MLHLDNRNWFAGSELTIHVNLSKTFKSPDIDVEIDTVPYSNVTALSLLKNNVVNAAGVVLRVATSNDKTFSIDEFKTSPRFWEFIFSPDHVLTANHLLCYGAKCLVRIACKIFQMMLTFD